MTSSKRLELSKQVAGVSATLVSGESHPGPADLLNIIDLCFRMETFCRERRLSSLCANQVGQPLPVFLCHEGGRWRKIVCPKYTPVGEGSARGLLRFPNVELDNQPRYFLVEFHAAVDAEYFEIEERGEPKLVNKNESGPLLWIQVGVDILGGRFPHEHGIEYLVKV
jgi:hypothetical protein